MPEGRYFHAAELSPSKQEIYIYGGLSNPSKHKEFKIFDDFWRFSLQAQRWELINVIDLTPPPLAGHTMTYIRNDDKDYLLLIGGLSSNVDHNVWLFSITESTWTMLATRGPMPHTIFGHTTVYHDTNSVCYVFGGYQYEKGKVIISNKLFAFDLLRLQWIELPPFTELNRPSELLPRARAFHSAISTNNYMLIFGGRTFPSNATDLLIAYVYKCNQWIRLTEDINFIGNLPKSTYAQAAAVDSDAGSVYIVGGWNGFNDAKVIKIQLPLDLCALYSNKKYLCRHFMGCSFCAIKPYEQYGSHCYSNDMNSVCNTHNATTLFNKGVECDAEWIRKRNCTSFSR